MLIASSSSATVPSPAHAPRIVTNRAEQVDFASLMESVALRLLGEPGHKNGHEWRYGNRGSLAIDIKKGAWFDHEADSGGGVIDLVAAKLKCDHDGAVKWLRQEGYIPEAQRGAGPSIAAVYDYRDENSDLLFQVCRFEPKDFRPRRPDGRFTLEGVRRVLYRLPEVLKAVNDGNVVYICEGEKDADSVCRLGFVATTNAGGANKWRDEYNKSLRGADVVLLLHNDDAGRKHAEQVAASLNGNAKRIRILDIAKHWAECPAKGDVTDWISAGGTANQLTTMVEALSNWESSHGRTSDTPLTAAEFLGLELPPRRMIVAPWLPEKGTVMVYSPRGVGKTLLGLTSAYAIAVGAGFLGFEIDEPRKVLYIDGEMPAQTIQDRLAAIISGFSKQPPTNEHFRILLADLTEFGLPDLASPEGQSWIDERISDADVIIADNISTLVQSGKENEAEGWLPVQNWALRHRRQGRAVVLLHHAGKGGAQRGTSKREDILDSVISLRHPADYSPDQGARFEVHFEKCRSFYGDGAQPFEARYEVRHGAATWTRTEIVDAERARVVAAVKDGLSIRDAAAELGMHRSKVERLKRKAMALGELSATATSEAAE